MVVTVLAAYLVVHPRATITLEEPGARVSQVVKRLAVETGLPLEADDTFAHMPIVVAVREVSADILLEKIAKAAVARWEHRPGGVRKLVPATPKSWSEPAEYPQAAWEKFVYSLRPNIDYSLKKFAPLGARPHKVDEDQGYSTDAQGRPILDGNSAATLYAYRALPTEAVLAILPGERVVFSTSPTPMQQALPLTPPLRQALELWKRETKASVGGAPSTIWVEVQREAAGPSMSLALTDDQGMIWDANGWDTWPTYGGVFSSPESDAEQEKMEAVLEEQDANSVTLTEEDVNKLTPPGPAFAPSPVVAAMRQLYVGEGKDPELRRRVDEVLRRPDLYETIRYPAGEIAVHFARVENVNFVGIFEATMPYHPRTVPAPYQEFLYWQQLAGPKTADGWTVLGPDSLESYGTIVFDRRQRANEQAAWDRGHIPTQEEFWRSALSPVARTIWREFAIGTALRDNYLYPQDAPRVVKALIENVGPEFDRRPSVNLPSDVRDTVAHFVFSQRGLNGLSWGELPSEVDAWGWGRPFFGNYIGREPSTNEPTWVCPSGMADLHLSLRRIREPMWWPIENGVRREGVLPMSSFEIQKMAVPYLRRLEGPTGNGVATLPSPIEVVRGVVDRYRLTFFTARGHSTSIDVCVPISLAHDRAYSCLAMPSDVHDLMLRIAEAEMKRRSGG